MTKSIALVFVSLLLPGCAASSSNDRSSLPVKHREIIYTEGTGIPHGTFEDEFLSHKKCSEWWYTTGYLEDTEGRMFAYQFTLARIKVAGIRFHMLLTSVTDLQNQKHYYNQDIVLFSFPKTGYRDSTCIQENGEYRRLNNYTVKPIDFTVEPETDYTFSRGWEISMPGVMEEEYSVVPKTEGQFNVFFYELLADVYNRDGEMVGYCYVELLPGARNDKLKSSLAFKRKK